MKPPSTERLPRAAEQPPPSAQPPPCAKPPCAKPPCAKPSVAAPSEPHEEPPPSSTGQQALPPLSPDQQVQVLEHGGLVEHHTRWGMREYGDVLTADEIRQTARMALVRSALRYNPSHGNFPGFAWKRMRGAITRRAGKEIRPRQLNRALTHYLAGVSREGSVLTDTPETARAEAIDQAQCALIAGTLGMLAHGGDAEELFVRREAAGAVRQAVDGLDGNYRRIIEQVHYEEQLLKDVAAANGWANSTTRRHRKSALSLLAEKLSRFAPATNADSTN